MAADPTTPDPAAAAAAGTGDPAAEAQAPNRAEGSDVWDPAPPDAAVTADSDTGPQSGDSPVPDTVAEALAEAEAAVLTDIEILEKERDDYLDALRRLQADFENYKKRTAKQQTDVLERAAQSLVDKLLPVLDAADLAVAHGADPAVTQIASLLTDTLTGQGLEAVAPATGEPFDPTLHEAVAHEPGEGGEQQVAGLLRAGYRWKGTLLRPAMVKVRG